MGMLEPACCSVPRVEGHTLSWMKPDHTSAAIIDLSFREMNSVSRVGNSSWSQEVPPGWWSFKPGTGKGRGIWASGMGIAELGLSSLLGKKRLCLGPRETVRSGELCGPSGLSGVLNKSCEVISKHKMKEVLSEVLSAFVFP